MTSPTASFTTQRFARQPGRSLLSAAAATAVLLGVGARMSTTPAETAAPATAPVSLSAPSPVLASSGRSDAMGCWVPGDLVGEGNPADLVAALCGRK